VLNDNFMKKVLLVILLLVTTFMVIRGQIGDYYDIAKNNMYHYEPPRRDYVIVIDYRKNLLENRLYVIDMKTGENVIVSRVSHAFKSGIMYPTFYSNKNGSNMSSKGNFITRGSTISPKYGYAMIIDGMDKGINTNAKNRAIIFHSDKNMPTKWSRGCFATPEETNKKIIDLTKNGCLVIVLT
jgi:hypothetical protein